MIEIEGNIKKHEDFEPVNLDYLEGLDIPDNIKEFPVEEGINSYNPKYNWLKITHMQENFDLVIPDKWIETERNKIVASFKILEAFVAFKRAVEEGLDKDEYIDDINKMIKGSLLLTKENETFSDSPIPKLTQEEIMDVVFYIGHFLREK